MRRRRVTFQMKFGALLAGNGIATIPVALFRYQGELGLAMQDVAVLSILFSYKWDERDPFPTIGEIARNAGCTPRAIQNILHRLERDGLLLIKPRTHQDGRQDANSYDLAPLRARLERLIGDEKSCTPTLKTDTSPEEEYFQDEESFASGVKDFSPLKVESGEIDKDSAVHTAPRYQQNVERLRTATNRAAVLRDVIQETLGVPIPDADIGRVGRQSKRAGGDGNLYRLAWLSAVDYTAVDDPLNWLDGVLRKRRKELLANAPIERNLPAEPPVDIYPITPDEQAELDAAEAIERQKTRDRLKVVNAQWMERFAR